MAQLVDNRPKDPGPPRSLLLRVPRSSVSEPPQSLNNGRRSPPPTETASPASPHPSSTTSSVGGGSAKVSDRIVKLSAIDPDGVKREVIGLSGQNLLKALDNFGLIDPLSHRIEDIEACSAECEVSIAEEWLEKLPRGPTTRSSRVRVLNRHSRLGCQVVLTPEMQGMLVAVPEPKPWDTP